MAVANAVAIKEPGRWPSRCHGSIQHDGQHSARAVATVVAMLWQWPARWPLQWPSRSQGGGHGGGHQGARVVAIAVPWQRPARWPAQCQGGGHGGGNAVAVASTVANAVAIKEPGRWPWWWPSRSQGGGHRGAAAASSTMASTVPGRWPWWWQCCGQHGGHQGARAVAIAVPWWWPRRRGPVCVCPPPQSVTGTFCPPHADAALVSCGLHRGRFLLSDTTFPGSTTALLKRPPFCPAKRLPPLLPAAPGVAAGVAVLLQASTGRILLTRRAGALSTFPGVWVPPGGHVEPDEELLAGGLRELAEETGLRLAAGTFSWRTLGLWESIYPPRLSQGLPRRHHIVTYLLLRSAECHRRLEAGMSPSAGEVSAYAWLEPPVLEAIAATEEGAERSGAVPEALPDAVGITELSGGTTRVPTGTFLSAAGGGQRVSTGTKFALGRWLEARGGARSYTPE
ncbi:nucleoside diphosphate-linked moiety X motif 17 isoform X2 [Tyto alba]|uniref:nucleoside diphosphate-linked moiety X motif 17 isoform X2 n=1 Tax=Tyto alba TaxID=56313 RepID=UPI001C6640C2|nr:nucleoside diphosphate-linked moiety X motif 17 isoform X2 [Tyto alba]